MFYIPSQINTRDDAVTAAQNILSNEFLFRTGIINDLISSTIWVFLVLILYRLFKQVNERQAKLLVALVIVQIPTVFIMEAFNITSLMIFKGDSCVQVPLPTPLSGRLAVHRQLRLTGLELYEFIVTAIQGYGL